MEKIGYQLPSGKERGQRSRQPEEWKQKELEIYSRDIFDTYQKRINELLATLGTDFTITGLTGKTDARANESYSDFGFLILEQTVPLATRQDDVPCFKNTLSEGDKSTLAFAFLSQRWRRPLNSTNKSLFLTTRFPVSTRLGARQRLACCWLCHLK